jgi:hypothetical protein
MTASPQRLRPLNVGNIVTAGFKLYGAKLGAYLSIALRAYLWIFVPVYGWAKFSLLSALIARLAFKELISEPEPETAGRRWLQERRFWSFLVLGLLMGLIFMGAYFALIIAATLIALPLGLIVGGIIGATVDPGLGTGIGFILGFCVAIPVILIGLIWFSARFSIADVALAIEDTTDSSDSIGRSWQLTKAHVWRISLVVTAAFLVTTPIIILTSYVPQIPMYLVEPNSPAFWLFYGISFIISLLGGILIMPFWQVIKAVLYYDLRTRREGLDIAIQDRP